VSFVALQPHDIKKPIGQKAMTDKSSPASNADVGKGRFISQVIGRKKRWRAYKARVRQLPENYRTAVDAIERYLMHFVPADAESAASEFEDLADLFERAAADGTPILQIVGDDPAEFVEGFAQHYTKGGYVPDRGRNRLTSAIRRAAGDVPGEKRAA
jgi:DNA-binding ferritin-like protein (Dps family)